MITLYKKNTRNITSLLYGFHDCREIKICREISKEFFAIDRFLHCTISGKICDRLRNFKGVFCDRSLIYCSLLYIFCTVNFAIDRKKFFWNFAIDRFILCTISGKNCDRSRNFKGVFCDRSLYLLFITVHFLYSEFCDRSQKILLNFCDQSVYSLYNFWKKTNSDHFVSTKILFKQD